MRVRPPHTHLQRNSLIYQSEPGAGRRGRPQRGGLLVEALTAPFALAADALSFLGSAFFLGHIRPAESAPAQDGQRGALSAGTRFIWMSPILRPSLACVSVINFFNFMFMALFVLYATRSLHVRPGPLGVVLGAGAIGAVLGALITGRIAARAGVGRAYLIGGGIDAGSSFVPPSSTVKLGHFSTVMLTTYSGFHSSLWGWYQHAKMIVTSDGTKTGVQRVAPSNLSTGGTAFDVNIVPGT